MNPEKTDSWKIVVLEHDVSSEEIGDFFEKIWQDGIIRKKIEKELLYRKNLIEKEIENAVKNLEGRILTLYGEGGFHHYTYGLCNAIAKKRSKDYTYIHIDNHSDSYYNKDGSINCAAFTRNILEEPEAKSLMLIGSDIELDSNLFISQLACYIPNYTVIHQKDIISENAKNLLKEELKRSAQDVYCSLDLDVLKRTEIKTNHQQGTLELKHLLQVLDVIKQEKNLISADMLGYYKLGIRRQPNHATNETSLLTYATLAAKITGKDTKEVETLHEYFKNKHLKHEEVAKEEFNKIINQLKI